MSIPAPWTRTLDPTILYQPQAPTLSRWGEYPWPLADFFTPAADIEETDDAYLMEIELPGAQQSDIDASVSGRRLTVSAAGERRATEREDVLRRQVRDVGHFRHEVERPGPDEADGVTAPLN